MTLYDRQIRTYGLDASTKLHSSIVYIIGTNNPYTMEVCKNLALTGVNTINLIGTFDSIQAIIQDLNPSIIINQYIEFGAFIENSCVVVINKPLDEAITINKKARECKAKTVYLNSNGFAGMVFVDAVNHTYSLGRDTNSITVKKIIKNLVAADNHNFEIGDTVQFLNVKGNNIDILVRSTWLIVDSNRHTFKITNTDKSLQNSDECEFINGCVKYIEPVLKLTHYSLQEEISNTDDIIKGLLGIKIHSQIKVTSFMTIPPVVSFISSIAAAEVIKLVSNKYIPISQWYSWSDFNIFSSYNTLPSVKFQFENLKQTLKNTNIVLVGCGALGCEWLKNLAYLDVKSIDVIDMDTIEHSNLSRQFLFRRHHVGMSKAKVAIEEISKINPNIILTAHECMLSGDSDQSGFINKIFNKDTIVINALDNIKARRYVDSICFERDLPLFESGTMGMKFNTQPIIPYLTETYSNTNDSTDDVEFPICTIKNFPNCIQHTIHWARDYFEMFTRGPINCNKTKESLDSLSDLNKTVAMEDIKFFLTNRPKKWYECKVLAKELFMQLFNHNIHKLLECFPKDHKVDGQLYWVHGKMCPTPLEYSTSYHVEEFINTTSDILCEIYGITTESQFNLTSLEFNKDNDLHIKWLTAASNCRAISYGITPVSSYETKGIAGKIIPAVATTTSIAVGLIGIEFLRYFNVKDITKYRSWFGNIADNTILYSEPQSHPLINIGKVKLNGWTKFTHPYNSSLSNLIMCIEEKLETKINMVLHNSTILYSDFTENKMETRLCDIVNTERAILTIISDDNIQVPPITLV